MSVQREPITPPVEPSFLLQLHVFKSDSLETLLRRYGYNEQERQRCMLKFLRHARKRFVLSRSVCLSVCMFPMFQCSSGSLLRTLLVADNARSVLVYLQVFRSKVYEHSLHLWRSSASLLAVIIQPCSPAFKGVDPYTRHQSNS